MHRSAGGRCFEGLDWELKAVSSESQARAALLSLLLDRPAGVAVQGSTWGETGTAMNCVTSPFPRSN